MTIYVTSVPILKVDCLRLCFWIVQMWKIFGYMLLRQWYISLTNIFHSAQRSGFLVITQNIISAIAVAATTEWKKTILKRWFEHNIVRNKVGAVLFRDICLWKNKLSNFLGCSNIAHTHFLISQNGKCNFHWKITPMNNYSNCFKCMNVYIPLHTRFYPDMCHQIIEQMNKSSQKKGMLSGFDEG